MISQVQRAQCHCGALTITVTATPVHVHACTCTQCQRVSGAALSWTAWFPKDAVQISGPTTAYDNPSSSSQHHFCPTCGTGRHIHGSAAYPDTIAISAGSFADPDFQSPAFILFWENKPRWLAATPDICTTPDTGP